MPSTQGVPSRVASPCEASSSEVGAEVGFSEVGVGATTSEPAERVLTRKMKPLMRAEEEKRRGGMRGEAMRAEEEKRRGEENERRGEEEFVGLKPPTSRSSC